MDQADDHRWDLSESDDGYLPQSDEAYEKKFEEWQARNWLDWLAKNLTFPFAVTREEDEDDAYFAPGAAKAPFRLGHKMDALVPGLLSAPPRDWMNGETLRYRLRPGGGFLLYSIGEDGKDENGDPAPSKAEKVYRQLADGRDAVWPVAATDAEAEAAMKAKNE